jgi:hypothetical protein
MSTVAVMFRICERLTSTREEEQVGEVGWSSPRAECGSMHGWHSSVAVAAACVRRPRTPHHTPSDCPADQSRSRFVPASPAAAALLGCSTNRCSRCHHHHHHLHQQMAAPSPARQLHRCRRHRSCPGSPSPPVEGNLTNSQRPRSTIPGQSSRTCTAHNRNRPQRSQCQQIMW